MINSNPNQLIQLSNEITGTDLNGTEFVIMKMYCNITANKSANFIYDIISQQAYETNKDAIRLKVIEFKTQCEEEALKYGVVVF